MSQIPPFSNANFKVEGIRTPDGAPMNMKVSAWLNTHVDDKFDDEKKKLVAEIVQQIIDNNFSLRLKFEHKVGDDYNAWPLLGASNLFANKPRDLQPGQQNSAPSPAPAMPVMPTPNYGGGNG